MTFIYLDSCIIIHYVEGTAAMQQAIARVLLDASGPRLAISDLTRLECRVGPLRSGDLALLADYDRFFRLPGIERLSLGEPVFDLATTLRAEQGLKTPDALHLAAAMVGGCEAFFTVDLRLEKAATGKISILQL